MDVCTWFTRFGSDPAAATKHKHNVVAAVAVAANDHSWFVVHVRGEKIGPNDRPLFAHNRHRAIGVLLTLDFGPVDVVDMPEDWFGGAVRFGSRH
ncbi:unannotated protein [freshwater metagenome]|uniref:Unannotated protein n=1 Tax=freshwater metagenome TaxID=449393 RepID=A0A6J7JN17_9ZZZZ